MALTVKKVTAVSVDVEDTPGVAAKLTAKLRKAGIDLKALAGWPKGEGQATVMVIPEDVDALRNLAAQESVTTTEEAVVWVEGPDEVGALCDFTDKLAAGNINIVVCQALGVGGNFAAVFSFADEATADRVIELTS